MHSGVLTPDVARAQRVAVQRQREALSRGLRDQHGANPVEGLKIHVVGARGELAFAMAMNVLWNESVNTFKSVPDVAGCEVRTRSKPDWALLVRHDDADDRAFVCVTAAPGAPQDHYGPTEFIVRGWMLGRDAKQARWERRYAGRVPAFFVPQHHLHGIESVPLARHTVPISLVPMLDLLYANATELFFRCSCRGVQRPDGTAVMLISPWCPDEHGLPNQRKILSWPCSR